MKFQPKEMLQKYEYNDDDDDDDDDYYFFNP